MVTIYPEYTSSILPKPKNFDWVTSTELRLYYPKKVNLETPDLKSEKLLRERKIKSARQAVLTPGDKDTHINQSTLSVNTKAVLSMELNKLIYATHSLKMLLD